MQTSAKFLGWQEWLELPDLGLPPILAKMDTGATTSALHAFQVERRRRKGQAWLRFWIHPVQGNAVVACACEAEQIEERYVTDSGGHRSLRPVILTTLSLMEASWPIEMTLTNRDTMRFRMLLGRSAMAGRFVVDPNLSFLAGHPES